MKRLRSTRIFGFASASYVRLVLVPAGVAVPLMVNAGTIVKANSAANLNTTTAWVGGVVPGAADTAQWDSTTATTTTNALGGILTWGGIKILNPGATVNLTTGNSLTNGAGGIDMTAASQDLILSNTLCIAPGAVQQWNVAAGHVLTVSAVPTKPGQPINNSGVLQVGTTGTVKMYAGTNFVITDNQGNPWVTYGLNDWAAIDPSSNVVAATYTEASGGVYTGNLDVDTSFSASGPGVQSVRFNQSTPYTFTVSGTSTATLRGILVTANSGGGSIVGSTAFVRPNRSTVANTSFDIIQNSPADFTISANLGNASSSTPVHVAKSGPGNLILSNTGNGYSGGTDINGGSLTVAPGASLGGGAVSVNGGRLVVNGSNTTFVAKATFNSGTTNSLKINTAGAQQFISTVVFNAGTTRSEFNFAPGVAPSTTTAPLLVSNVTANGTVTVDIFNNSLTTGIYPLIKYTNSLAGSGFSAFNLGFMPSRSLGYLSNDTANTSIDLVVTNINEPIHWAVGNGTWDINGTANWQDTLGASTTYQELVTPYSSLGDAVVFSDAASGSSPITVTLNANTIPAAATINATKNYTITGNGSIGGGASLTKSGSGTLVLGITNSFTGGLNLNGGVLNFNTLSNLGAGSIAFNGGTLQYNGNSDDISTRTVTFGAAGGTIDTAGQAVTYLGPIGNLGAGGLTKTGNGTLTLDGTNRYAGNTIINQGTLALGGNSYISNGAAILVGGSAILDTASSGVGLTLDGGQILGGSGTVNGMVTVPVGATISPGTNGTVATLTLGNDLVFSGGTYAYGVSTTAHDLLIVNGNLTLNSGTILTISAGALTNGVYKVIQYAGSLLSGAGSSANLVISGFSQAGKLATLSDATPGEIDLVVVTQGGAVKVWQGDGGNNFWDVETTADWTNSSGAAAQFVQGDLTFFDDTSANTTVNLQTAVQPGSVTVNGTQSYTLMTSGTGRISGNASLTNNSTGTLTIETTDNNSGQTVINAGVVQVGNGGGGDLGSGKVINNTALVFGQGDGNVHTVEQISGPGGVTQNGSATVAYDQNNTYAGGTAINGGYLQVGAGVGAAGSLGTGPVTNNSVLVINRSGTYTLNNAVSGSGTLAFAGSGVVTLSGANSYMNNTYVTNGTVKLGAAEEIPDANSVPGSTGWLILDGGATAGTFDLNGFNETINSLSGLAGTVNGLVTNSATSTTTTNVLTVLENAATTYNGLITENANGSKVQVVVRGNAELRLNGNNTYGGGTVVGDTATIGVGSGGAIGKGSITLSNGTTFFMHTATGGQFAGNTIVIPDNSAATFTSANLGNGYTGSVVGGPTATNIISNVGGAGFSFSAANLMQHSNFLGTVVIPSGSSLRYSDSTSTTMNEGGTGAIFDVEGSIFGRNGGTANLGALEGAGSIAGPSTLGTMTWVIGARNMDSIFSGTINNSLPSTNNAIVKTGTGRLTLSGALTYLGNTTVNGGVLALVDPAMLDNSPTITLSSNTAAIDVTGRSDVSLNLGNINPQILAGNGNVFGSLNEAVTTTNNLTLGTLNVTGTATVNGALNLQINRTNTPNCSKLSAASFVNGGSIVLTVTNIGATNLAAGDTFQLFNKAFPGTFVATNLPVLPSANLYWTNYIGVNGSIVVESLVNTTPTNLVASFTGGTLSLSWPADHLGWYLQAQTNALGHGLGTNWVDVPGSSGVTSVSVPVNPVNATVFYRMSLNP